MTVCGGQASFVAAARTWSWLFLAVALLALPGCGERQAEPEGGPSPFFDLQGVPLSADLQAAIAAGYSSLPETRPTNRTVRDVKRYRDLAVRIKRPASRQEAGDELYALWRSDPENFLWIGLATRYNGLLRRTGERNEMYALPALADTTGPVGAFVRGRRFYRYGDRGEFYRRAERGRAGLDSLQQIWLERKLALVESHAGRNLAAVERLLGGIRQARALGGCFAEYYLWLDIARFLLRDDRLDDALHAAALSGAMAGRSGSAYCTLRSRVTIANILATRREYGEALAILEECLAAAAAGNYPWLYAHSADLAASVCGNLGRPEQALEIDRMVFGYNLAVADSMNTPRSLVNIADDFRLLGQLDSCRVYLRRARSWVDLFPHPRNRALLPRFEAEYFCQIGDYAAAESLLSEARAGLSVASLAVDEAELLLRLIRQGLERGQAEVAYRAIDRLRQLRGVLHDSEPDKNLVADFEIATADFLARQGEFRLAAEAHVRAREAVAAGGGTGQEWEYLRSAGELALLRGDIGSARESFAASLSLAGEAGNSDQLARSRFHFGHVLLLEEKFVQARELFLDHGADSAFGGRFRTRLSSLLFLGMSCSRAGEFAEALAYFERARGLCVSRSPADLRARLEVETGLAQAALGEWRRAEVSFLRALELGREEEGRSQVGELRSFCGNLLRDATEALIGLYLDHAELLPAEDLGRHTFLLAEQNRHGGSGRGRGGDPGPVLQVLLDQRRSPLLAFFVGRTRSFAWVVAAGRVDLLALPARRELNELLLPTLADMENPARPVEPGAAHRLGQVLLGPVVSHWREGSTLLIIPDDLLFGMPWSGLFLPRPADSAGAKVALDHGPVVEAPCLVSFGLEEAVPPGRIPVGRGSLLALGIDSADRGLPAAGSRALHHAESEARGVADLWSGGEAVLRVGREASWDQVAGSGLERFAVLHIATHAVAFQGLPTRSTIRFAGGEGAPQLTIPAVGKLVLNADLVYLSCCEASRRLSGASTGLMDFAGAFLQAGARSVIASTLRVDDEASRFLAERFYGHWLAGETKAVALRMAQQDVRAAGGRWEHPYFWAYYRLIGGSG